MFAFYSQANYLANSFRLWAMGAWWVIWRRNIIILVSFFKKSWKLSNSHKSPMYTAGTCVRVAEGRRRSESDFFLLPEEFLVGPNGVHEDTDGDGTRPHGISCGFCTVFISQKTLLPSYLGALVSLFFVIFKFFLPLKGGTLSGLLWLRMGVGRYSILYKVSLIFLWE